MIQFKLMLPAALKTRVEEQASANRRSLSQEIVATLEEKYPPEPDLASWAQDVQAYFDSLPMSEREKALDLFEGNVNRLKDAIKNAQRRAHDEQANQSPDRTKSR